MRNFIIIVFSFFIVSCGLRLRTPFTQPAKLSVDQLDNLNVNVQELSTNQFYWKLQTDSRFAWDYERYLMNQDYIFWSDYYWNNRLWMNGHSSAWQFYNARWRFDYMLPYQFNYYNNWMWRGYSHRYGGWNNWNYLGNVYNNPTRLLINGRRGPSLRVGTNRRNEVRPRRVNRERNNVIRESNNNIIRESNTPTRVKARRSTPPRIRSNNRPVRTRTSVPVSNRPPRISAPSRTSGNTTVIKVPTRGRRQQ